MEVALEPFKYLYSLFENVKLLFGEVAEKNEVLASSEAFLSMMEAAIVEVTQSLEPS